mmetsp:Transcript_33806/g.52661  ORF Transcript_33806/g.52661 Transcript_33806/m.52661 type:complete len:546 (-) Transcript_33806:224-1861(-)
MITVKLEHSSGLSFHLEWSALEGSALFFDLQGEGDTVKKNLLDSEIHVQEIVVEVQNVIFNTMSQECFRFLVDFLKSHFTGVPYLVWVGENESLYSGSLRGITRGDRITSTLRSQSCSKFQSYYQTWDPGHHQGVGGFTNEPQEDRWKKISQELRDHPDYLQVMERRNQWLTESFSDITNKTFWELFQETDRLDIPLLHELLSERIVNKIKKSNVTQIRKVFGWPEKDEDPLDTPQTEIPLPSGVTLPAPFDWPGGPGNVQFWASSILLKLDLADLYTMIKSHRGFLCLIKLNEDRHLMSSMKEELSERFKKWGERKQQNLHEMVTDESDPLSLTSKQVSMGRSLVLARELANKMIQSEVQRINLVAMCVKASKPPETLLEELYNRVIAERPPSLRGMGSGNTPDNESEDQITNRLWKELFVCKDWTLHITVMQDDLPLDPKYGDDGEIIYYVTPDVNVGTKIRNVGLGDQEVEIQVVHQNKYQDGTSSDLNEKYVSPCKLRRLDFVECPTHLCSYDDEVEDLLWIRDPHVDDRHRLLIRLKSNR